MQRIEYATILIVVRHTRQHRVRSGVAAALQHCDALTSGPVLAAVFRVGKYVIVPVVAVLSFVAQASCLEQHLAGSDLITTVNVTATIAFTVVSALAVGLTVAGGYIADIGSRYVATAWSHSRAAAFGSMVWIALILGSAAAPPWVAVALTVAALAHGRLRSVGQGRDVPVTGTSTPAARWGQAAATAKPWPRQHASPTPSRTAKPHGAAARTSDRTHLPRRPARP